MLNKLYKIKFLGHPKDYRTLQEITVYGRVVEETDDILVLAAWDLPNDEDREENWETIPILKSSVLSANLLKVSRSKKIQNFINKPVIIEFMDHVRDSKNTVMIQGVGVLISDNEENYTFVSLDFDEDFDDRESNWVIFTILKSAVRSIKKLNEYKPRIPKEIKE